MNKLAIIILNWNGHDDTIECIKSIREREEGSYPIFLLDNGSKSESVSFIEEWIKNNYTHSYEIVDLDKFSLDEKKYKKELFFIKGTQNLGFAKGNNIIWNKIKDVYNYVLLLNNDTVIEKNAISKMIDYMEGNPDTGALSCDIRLYSDRKKLWNAGGFFTWYGERKYYKQTLIDEYKKNGVKSIETPFITGCAMMIRKSTTNKIGVFTERFFFGEEDFNYCKKLTNSGVKVESLLDTVIYHKVGTSIKKNQKSINGYILHFSNRILNQKEFQSTFKWILWSSFYKMAIFLKIMKIEKDLKLTIKVLKNINYYTKKNSGIDYETFLEINSIK